MTDGGRWMKFVGLWLMVEGGWLKVVGSRLVVDMCNMIDAIWLIIDIT